MKPVRIIVIFTAGILSGWGIHSGVAGARGVTSPAAAAETRDARKKSDRPQVTEEARWASFGKKAKAAKREDIDGFLKDLAPADRMTALETLAAQAGIWGVSGTVENIMERLLWDWMAADFDGAWYAARECGNPDLREFMFKMILEKVEQTEPARALELELKRAEVDPDFKTEAVSKFQRDQLKEGAEEYLASLRRFSLVKVSGWSEGVYARDFDFKLAADGIAGMIRESNGKGPAWFPTNFLQEWANRDPQAAYDWWEANPSPPFNPPLFNDVSGILAGIEQKSPGGSTAWIVEKLQDPAAPRERLAAGLSGGSNEDLIPRINAIAGALSDPADADSFLRDVFVDRSHGRMDRSAFALTGMSSPEARLEALRAMAGKHKGAGMGKVSDAQFAAWGITRQQAEQALGKKK